MSAITESYFPSVGEFCKTHGYTPTQCDAGLFTVTSLAVLVSIYAIEHFRKEAPVSKEEPANYFKQLESLVQASGQEVHTLKWEDRFMLIDYISNVTPGDLSHPVMRGVDCVRRQFFAFKLYFTREEGVKTREEEGERSFVVFERYNDDDEHRLSSVGLSPVRFAQYGRKLYAEDWKEFLSGKDIEVCGGSARLCSPVAHDSEGGN